MFQILRWPGLIKRYEEKVCIASGCQTLLFHMWSCHKQWNGMSWTEHYRGSHTIENSCCVAVQHHYQRQNARADMKYYTCMTRRTQCIMWPHLLLLLILMMVMMVIHHAISSWFHSIRCMTILFFITRALSHIYLRLNIRSNAWKRKDGNESVIRETCVPATLPRDPQEGNLKFQPPHTGN